MSYAHTKTIQDQRARTDFEAAIGADLTELLARPEVKDVNIRPSGCVVYRDNTGKHIHEVRLSPDESETTARAILQCMNPVPELNDEHPSADVRMRLSDAQSFARVHIDIPVSGEWPGYQICIRKQSAFALTFEDGWIAPGFMHRDLLDVFRWTIDARLNVWFCGKMFSGKTSARNSHFALMHERDPDRGIVEIMDVEETVISHFDYSPQFITKQSSAADLCRRFVRMSSEAVGINELRGGDEANELINNLWQSGHNGSSTTFHVEDPDELIYRARTLIEGAHHQFNPDALINAAPIAVFIRYAPSIGRKITQIAHLKGVTASGKVEYENLGPVFPWPHQALRAQYRPSTAA